MPRTVAKKGLTGRQLLAASMTETELQDNIIAVCRPTSVLCYHTHNSRHSAKGYPDLHLLNDWSLFRELKNEYRPVTAEQKTWILRLRAAGYNADVWRPRDWVCGRVQDELSLLRSPQPAVWPWGWLWTP